jgi:hypothetical protein
MAPKQVFDLNAKDAWGERWKEDPWRKKPGTRPGVSQPIALDQNL